MLQDFLSLLFPEICHACDQPLARGERYICTECNVKLPYTDLHLHGATELNCLQQRFWGKVPVRFAFSYLHFRSKGRVQRVLHKLKYKGAQELGEHLGKRYGAILLDQGYAVHFDLIVPVPLHRLKLRRRGYNQSEGFAKGLAEALQIPWSNRVLERAVDTDSQTKKSRLDRWQNVEQVFAVKQMEAVKGKRILLVDDVLTTGATLEACAQALLQKGCSEVSVTTIAAA
ncbi:ComF family protein [Pontibacter amylolyticus]|uniref:Amidophosphoribosyltransferase n=1 Tax=Pontibacter amylolyticus TaxID=1424080 RepID=A0ABQ1W460_9BACT|nr:ComF family protein [Pontibacter amylolyticus]GGG10534.1 amidophosphoribosyltransferase [Pontibacter amylolyticus]